MPRRESLVPGTSGALLLLPLPLPQPHVGMESAMGMEAHRNMAIHQQQAGGLCSQLSLYPGIASPSGHCPTFPITQQSGHGGMGPAPALSSLFVQGCPPITAPCMCDCPVA